MELVYRLEPPFPDFSHRVNETSQDYTVLSHLLPLPFLSPPFCPQKQYKQKFEKEKGKSKYNNMSVPPDVQHAMDVAKNQSNFAYRQGAKAKLNYTSVAMRPDIMKATQASKLTSNVSV
uniref:Uncharacterized protein n=1 Tax=Hucho hucho TaxID=62062 RepID=A0A4W5RSK0_9TELE